jgi:hypothetical protein
MPDTPKYQNGIRMICLHTKDMPTENFKLPNWRIEYFVDGSVAIAKDVKWLELLACNTELFSDKESYWIEGGMLIDYISSKDLLKVGDFRHASSINPENLAKLLPQQPTTSPV